MIYSIDCECKKYPLVEAVIKDFKAAFPKISIYVSSTKQAQSQELDYSETEYQIPEELNLYFSDLKDIVKGTKIPINGKCIECTIEKDVRVNYAVKEVKAMKKTNLLQQTKGKTRHNKYLKYFSSTTKASCIEDEEIKTTNKSQDNINPINSIKQSIIEVRV